MGILQFILIFNKCVPLRAADKMENIMSTIGLSVDKLPQAGVANLATLSSIALTLDTNDTSLTRYVSDGPRQQPFSLALCVRGATLTHCV
jgi:hypothetical protein